MIQNRSCVNGILAAVLSARIVPTHGALAKEKTPTPQKTAGKKAANKIDHPAARRIEAPNAPGDDKNDASKPETSGANAPATLTQ